MAQELNMKAVGDLVYLVSRAVNDKKPDKEICSKMDIDEVFEAARRHSLTAAAAIALEQVMKLPETVIEEQFKAVRRLALYDIERKKILAEFEKEGIWYLPLKGIVMRRYYPKTSMREMSDNDILCDPSKMLKIKEIMESLGYTCRHFGKNHHDVYEKQPKIEFEMHRALVNKLSWRKMAAYYEDIKDRLVKDEDNGYGYHMTDEDFYIFLICHVYKHYSKAGTGLRSALDVYLYDRALGDKLDREYLDRELEKLELVRFEEYIRGLSKKLFTGGELTEDETRDLCFLAESNSHGTAENLMARKLGNDDSLRAKREYVMNRLFPTGEYLQKKHPFVYSHKALYPLWIVYRPIKGLTRHRKKMIAEIRRVKGFKSKANIKITDNK